MTVLRASRLTSTLKPSLSFVCRDGVDSTTSSGPFEVVETLLFRPGMMGLRSTTKISAESRQGLMEFSCKLDEERSVEGRVDVQFSIRDPTRETRSSASWLVRRRRHIHQLLPTVDLQLHLFSTPQSKWPTPAQITQHSIEAFSSSRSPHLCRHDIDSPPAVQRKQHGSTQTHCCAVLAKVSTKSMHIWPWEMQPSHPSIIASSTDHKGAVHSVGARHDGTCRVASKGEAVC